MYSVKTEPASKWITILVIHLICITIGFLILRSETRKRKLSTTIFPTIWFKLFSITCIASYFMYQMFQSLEYIPGFCVFSNYFSRVFVAFLYTAMGSYQLYRLYYCFANEQVHSNKGYPKCVFIIMGVSGVIGLNHLCISVLFLDIEASTVFRSECGYNDKYEFYFHPIQLFGPRAIMPGFYFSLLGLGFSVWDILTLCLYIMKIWRFKKYATEEPIVYKRIMSILLKVFILTVFYEVFFILYGISLVSEIGIQSSKWWLALILSQLSHLSVCCSMYLMLDHNKQQYLKFLRIISMFRFHLICFCWRHYVIDEIDSLERDIQQLSNSVNDIQKNADNNNNHQSQLQTGNISIDNHKIKLPELSVATETEH